MRRGVPFEAALDRGLGDLPPADRRLAHELAAGVLRRAETLDAELAPRIPRGLDSVQPVVRDILRLGAYQLRHLERVPAHAAVGTAVTLAREAMGERVTGFVNAVLRALARAPRTEPPPPEADRDDGDSPDAAERLAREWSHPLWLVARWLRFYGADDTARLLEWNNTRPALVVQPARESLGSLERRFAAAGVAAFSAPHGAGLVVDAARPEALPGFAEGAFFVQDPAQALVARFAAFPPGGIVFDACAAPGGKTLALARHAGRLVSADRSRRRVARLRENLARAGSGRERVLLADARHPPVRAVDGYLLDAPCLGTGTFARHPDARLRVTREALQELAATQADLLAAAADRVRPGGVLCYATCSLEPEEDEVQVDRFLARHPEYRREPPDDIPAGLLTEAGDLLILPHRDGMDGAFAARLVRSA